MNVVSLAVAVAAVVVVRVTDVLMSVEQHYKKTGSSHEAPGPQNHAFSLVCVCMSKKI